LFESIKFTRDVLEEHHTIQELNIEPLNIEYESCYFRLANHTYRSRRAKKTPNKKGYFVVFWVKDENNKNRPYTYEESADKLIITIMDADKKGQFIIPKEVLLKKHIISHNNIKGKMAMRVYPSWEANLNKTAAQTQNWQQDYFIDLSDSVDSQNIAKLYQKVFKNKKNHPIRK